MTNDPVNVPVYRAYAFGPGPIESNTVTTYLGCKRKGCERFACTASAERCSYFCCPACFDGTGHTSKCDENFPPMLARMVPGAAVKMSNEVFGLHDPEQA